MMWPVSEFYNGSNELAADELRLAALFREKGREDLASCVMEGRKIQISSSLWARRALFGYTDIHTSVCRTPASF